MAKDKIALLILRRPRGYLRLEPVELHPDGKLALPLQWFAMRRLAGAQLLDRHLHLSSVERADICGIAGPRSWGGLDLSYLLVVTLGWLTLAVPVLVRLGLTQTREMTIEGAQNYIADIVENSLLDGGDKKLLLRRIHQARTLSAMSRAIEDARE